MTDESVDPVTGEVGTLVVTGKINPADINTTGPLQVYREPMAKPPEPDRSEALNELAAALAKAQGRIQAASKDRTNPHFQSKYATLASCWEACREPLSSNGLALIQRVVASSREVVAVETLLVHASGQWIRTTVRLPVDKPTSQGVGSAVTYGRRFGLSAMVGVAPDDDDDGNAASGKSAPAQGQTVARTGTYARPAKPDPRLTPEQNQQAEELFRSGR